MSGAPGTPGGQFLCTDIVQSPALDAGASASSDDDITQPGGVNLGAPITRSGPPAYKKTKEKDGSPLPVSSFGPRTGGAPHCFSATDCICTFCRRPDSENPNPKSERLWTFVLVNGDVVWTKYANYIREWQRFKAKKVAAGDPVPPPSRSQSQSAGAPAAGTAKASWGTSSGKRSKSHGGGHHWKGRSSASRHTQAPPPPPPRGTTSYSASLWATGGYEG